MEWVGVLQYGGGPVEWVGVPRYSGGPVEWVGVSGCGDPMVQMGVS